jgi:hypothetical protein
MKSSFGPDKRKWRLRTADRDPRRNRKNLLFRPVSPTGLIGLLERGPQRLDGPDLPFRSGDIAGARRSETARETIQ